MSVLMVKIAVRYASTSYEIGFVLIRSDSSECTCVIQVDISCCVRFLICSAILLLTCVLTSITLVHEFSQGKYCSPSCCHDDLFELPFGLRIRIQHLKLDGKKATIMKYRRRYMQV